MDGCSLGVETKAEHELKQVDEKEEQLQSQTIITTMRLIIYVTTTLLLAQLVLANQDLQLVGNHDYDSNQVIEEPPATIMQTRTENGIQFGYKLPEGSYAMFHFTARQPGSPSAPRRPHRPQPQTFDQDLAHERPRFQRFSIKPQAPKARPEFDFDDQEDTFEFPNKPQPPFVHHQVQGPGSRPRPSAPRPRPESRPRPLEKPRAIHNLPQFQKPEPVSFEQLDDSNDYHDDFEQQQPGNFQQFQQGPPPQEQGGRFAPSHPPVGVNHRHPTSFEDASFEEVTRFDEIDQKRQPIFQFPEQSSEVDDIVISNPGFQSYNSMHHAPPQRQEPSSPPTHQGANGRPLRRVVRRKKILVTPPPSQPDQFDRKGENFPIGHFNPLNLNEELDNSNFNDAEGGSGSYFYFNSPNNKVNIGGFFGSSDNQHQSRPIPTQSTFSEPSSTPFTHFRNKFASLNSHNEQNFGQSGAHPTQGSSFLPNHRPRGHHGHHFSSFDHPNPHQGASFEPDNSGFTQGLENSVFSQMGQSIKQNIGQVSSNGNPFQSFSPPSSHSPSGFRSPHHFHHQPSPSETFDEVIEVDEPEEIDDDGDFFFKMSHNQVKSPEPFAPPKKSTGRPFSPRQKRKLQKPSQFSTLLTTDPFSKPQSATPVTFFSKTPISSAPTSRYPTTKIESGFRPTFTPSVQYHDHDGQGDVLHEITAPKLIRPDTELAGGQGSLDNIEYVTDSEEVAYMDSYEDELDFLDRVDAKKGQMQIETLSNPPETERRMSEDTMEARSSDFENDATASEAIDGMTPEASAPSPTISEDDFDLISFLENGILENLKVPSMATRRSVCPKSDALEALRSEFALCSHLLPNCRKHFGPKNKEMSEFASCLIQKYPKVKDISTTSAKKSFRPNHKEQKSDGIKFRDDKDCTKFVHVFFKHCRIFIPSCSLVQMDKDVALPVLGCLFLRYPDLMTPLLSAKDDA